MIIWKWLQNKYTELVTVLEILNLEVLSLTVHKTVEGGKLKKELLLVQLRRLGNKNYCKDFREKQELRDNNEMAALEPMEWFINHNCFRAGKMDFKVQGPW